MHAASTMKVPVMMELFRRRAAGELAMDLGMVLRNVFTSIADGQTYSLTAGDDSDPALYERVGGEVAVSELMERMITRSRGRPSPSATTRRITVWEPVPVSMIGT